MVLFGAVFYLLSGCFAATLSARAATTPFPIFRRVSAKEKIYKERNNNVDLFGILAIPFAYVMRFLYYLLHNYGLCLVVFTVIVKLILLPLSIKQQKGLMKQAVIAPKLNELKEKYKDDPRKQSEEMQRLQAENGVSSFSGCLPLLIQFPIIIGLYQVIRKPLTYIFGFHAANCGLLASALGWTGKMVEQASEMQIQLLSQINRLGSAVPSAVNEIFGYYGKTAADYAFDNTILGIDLGGTPNIAQPSILWLIPLFAVAGAILQSYISQKFVLKESKTRMSTIMAYSAALISLIFAFTLPAAIGFYWGLSSFLGCIQTYFLGRKYDPNKYVEELENQKRSEKEQAKIDKKLRRLERLKQLQEEQEAIKAKYRNK